MVLGHIFNIERLASFQSSLLAHLPNHGAASEPHRLRHEQRRHHIDVRKLLDQPWYKYKHLRKLYCWMSVVLLVQATNGLDGSIMNGMQTLTYWQSYFHHPTGAQLGLFNGTQGLGGVFSQLFLWWLVEKIGRKLVIIAGAVIIIIGVFLQSFANGLVMVSPSRLSESDNRPLIAVAGDSSHALVQ